MNEKELFDALAKDCPNELAKHDAKVRADVIDEFLELIEKRITESNHGLYLIDAMSFAEQLKEQNND